MAAERLAEAAEAIPLMYEDDMDDADSKTAELEMGANLADPKRRNTAVAAATAARQAEARGIEALKGVLAALA